MATITSTGIGSGLDVTGIVQQLVAAEAAPVETRIGLQEAREQAKLSALGSLKSALVEFRDLLENMMAPERFLARKGSSGNQALFTVSVTEAALPASFSVEVEQLAEAQKLTSAAMASPDVVIGTGTLTLAVGANSFDVEIGDEENTLEGIRDAINAAPDNTGIAATIVNADTGSYLILTAEDTGLANTMTVTQAGGDGGLSVLEYDPGGGLNALTESVAPQDARVLIDGLAVNSSTNTVSGAIDGVTLSLVSADPGNPTTLLVENDSDAVRETIDEFVEIYNLLVDTFDEQTRYDAELEVAAPLLGDAAVRGIREQIRRDFSVSVESIELPFQSLAEIGIQVQLDGRLEIEDASLDAALQNDFTQVGQLFTATDGYAVRLFNLVEGFLDSDGIIEAKEEGLNDRIEGFTEQREDLAERLISLEERLLRQFTALDSLISQLTNTSNFLTQQLDNLPGATRPGSS